MSCVTCHVSPVMYHLSCVTCHVSRVRCHLSPVASIFFVPEGPSVGKFPGFSPVSQTSGFKNRRKCVAQELSEHIPGFKTRSLTVLIPDFGFSKQKSDKTQVVKRKLKLSQNLNGDNSNCHKTRQTHGHCNLLTDLMLPDCPHHSVP